MKRKKTHDGTLSLSHVKKKFTMKELAYDYKKASKDMVRQLDV